MNWLADEIGQIEIQLGNDTVIQVSNYPLTFTSPVSYTDPEIDTFSIATEEEEQEYDDELDDIENGKEE
jgi:hypothetical protein